MKRCHLSILLTATATTSLIHLPPSHAAASSSSTTNMAPNCLPPEVTQLYKIINNTKVSSDSNILTVALPDGRKYLGWDDKIPTCIAISKKEEQDGDDGNKTNILKKSYSPITHPSQPDTFQLLVKSYPPRIGGGVGSYLCNLQTNDVIEAKVKPQRIMHSYPHVHGRWSHIGLIAGGTGIAPLYQLLMILLKDCTSSNKIHVLSINRKEEDILLKKELDDLVSKYPDKLIVTYSLTGENDVDNDMMKDNDNNGRDGYRIGRGNVQLAQEALPHPSLGKDVMIFVCGKDGFVEHWGGKVGRAPNNPDGSKGAKIQGPLMGVLREAGYDASQVFKY